MALPWLLALKAIPWATIVANAPTIARSAEVLLAGTRQDRAPAASRHDLRVLEERVAALEDRDRQMAELIAQTTAQVEALTAATRLLEARVRWLLLATALSAVLAFTALVLLLIRI